jgi:uncharacterized phage protein gp47/JayE
MLARLRSVIVSLHPNWPASTVAEIGNILLELWCFAFDNVAYYQNALARETRITTARQRKNLIALGRLINFEARTASPATVDMTVTLGSVPSLDVDIPLGYVFSTQSAANPVRFRTLVATTITAGTDPPVATVAVENSETINEDFVSNGQTDQEFQLARVGYIDDSLEVSASNGVYSQVSSFVDSLSTDRHFMVEVDENDRAKIIFGDGGSTLGGAIPVGAILATYKIGGGVDGNVAANAITQISTQLVDSNGTPVVATATNASAATGGADRETDESIRSRAPRTLRVLNRSVAREDFEIVAEGIEGVARTLMLSRNEDTSVPVGQGFLYVIPEGGGTPSSTLLTTVEDAFTGEDATYPMCMGYVLNVRGASYKTIDVRAVVYLGATAVASEVRTNVLVALTALFEPILPDGTKNEEIGFGYELQAAGQDAEVALSTVYNAVRDSDGVRKMGTSLTDFTLNGSHADVALELREFPTLGTLTLINGDTDEEIT